MVRDFIVENGREWEEMIHGEEFQNYFTVQGTALKNVPRGYDKEHPQAEFLKFKSWYLEYPLSDAEVKEPEGLLHKSTEIFRVMKPFNDYLNRALAGFQMPKR